MLIFTLICLLVGIFVTQKVISPISRLIENAKKNGEYYTKIYSASDCKNHFLIYDQTNTVLKKDYYISVEKLF